VNGSIFKEQIEHADRIAREIEGTVSSNIHLQEERGHLGSLLSSLGHFIYSLAIVQSMKQIILVLRSH
jgi:PAB1-binding protein PBP1